jgi:hypothetical protein
MYRVAKASLQHGMAPHGLAAINSRNRDSFTCSSQMFANRLRWSTHPNSSSVSLAAERNLFYKSAGSGRGDFAPTENQ